MIVVVEPQDRRLGLDVLRRLTECGCAPANGRIHILDDIGALQRDENLGAVFVVATELERLTFAIKTLREITKRPLVAVSSAGFFPQMISVLRAGAADFLDICSSFEVDGRRILTRLHRQRDRDEPSLSQPFEVRLHDSLGQRPRRDRRFISGS